MVMRNKRRAKIGVQKKLMVMRNKISDKNRCAEEVYGNKEKKKRLKIGVQKKFKVMWNKISDKNWCAEEVDDNEEQKKR